MPSLICTSGIHCANCQGKPEMMAALKIDKCDGPFTQPPTERERAMQAAARGDVYAPPGRCRGCGG
jgi:hypothetical protein